MRLRRVRSGGGMIPIKAPEGFEAVRCYQDATREWRVQFRAIGDTWWTNAYLDAGHAWLPAEELDARAEASVIHALKSRGLL
jgi:hypothetical protein